MIRKTGARRLAALTSGALMAGGLVAAPALTGLATASAAPVTLNYTCNATTPFAPVVMPGTVTIETTTPASAAPGATVPVGVSFDADFGSLSMGPVSELTGSFDIPLSLGSDTATFTTPTQTAPNTALVYSGSGSVDLTAPDAAGDAPITVGTITGNFSAMGMEIPATCTPAEGQDLTVGTLNVDGEGPVDPEPETPEGILYECVNEMRPDDVASAYIDVDVTDLPESTDQGSGYDPALDATVTWGEGASDMFRAIELEVESAHLHLGANFAQGEGQTEIALTSTEVPAEGNLVWSGSGNFGVLDTSVPGTHDLILGDGEIELIGGIVYTGGAPFDLSMECTVADGQDTVIGSVTVNESGTSPACVDAQAKADKAQAKVKKTKAQVKKAKAKVKKAKGKQAKAKAKKQLKNAKTKAKKAKKQLKKAKAALADC